MTRSSLMWHVGKWKKKKGIKKKKTTSDLTSPTTRRRRQGMRSQADSVQGGNFSQTSTVDLQDQVNNILKSGSIIVDKVSSAKLEPISEEITKKIEKIKSEPYEPKRSTSLKRSKVSEWAELEKKKFRDSQEIRVKERTPNKPVKRYRVRPDVENMTLPSMKDLEEVNKPVRVGNRIKMKLDYDQLGVNPVK